MGKNLLLIFIGVLFVSACTKNKEPAFGDGEGQDLLVVADYDNKVEVLKLKEASGNLVYRSLEKKTAEPGANKLSVSIVKFETPAKLFPKDLILTGLPNTEVRVKYKISEKELVLYKNGNPEQFPEEEKVMAETEEDGTRSLQIASYDITGFFQVVISKDDQGNKTSRLRENAVDNKSQATHFKISRVPKVKSLPDFKKLMLKASYFEGSWYTSSVISKTSEEEKSALGYMVSFDSKMNSADKVTFVKTEAFIVGLNANHDARITVKTTEDKLTNLTQTIKIPVEYVDFDQAKRADKNTITDFEKNTKIQNWSDREWVHLDLVGSSSPITNSIAETPTLSGVKMTDDFFMYSLQYNGKKVTISFLREKSVKTRTKVAYTPRVAFYDDFKYFGFFVTEKQSLNTFDKHRRGDYEKNRLINRFHPETYTNKKGETRRRVRFVMTEESTTDKVYVDLVGDALASWDVAFKQAGLTDVDVYLDTDERVTLGDIRFNTINMFSSLTSSYLLGYGPSLADPDTGEIVSATTNIHLTSIRDNIITHLRNYVRHKRGELAANYPLGAEPVLTSGGVILGTPESQKSENSTGEKGGRCNYASSYKDFVVDVEREVACKPLIVFAKESQKQSGECKGSQCSDSEVLLKCAEALVPKRAAGTILHELGHNFGLRHNFAASSDWANYPKVSDKPGQTSYCSSSPGKSNGKEKFKSASVMDYTDIGQDRNTEVGPYDIEAIRYGYGGQILWEKPNSCEPMVLNSSASIDSNLAAARAKIHKIKFCTDDHVEASFDALCQRHDAGSNYTETAKSTINMYNALYALQNFRYDKAKSLSAAGISNWKQVYLNRLMLIYETWRQLLVEYMGEGTADLDNVSAEEFERIQEKMRASFALKSRDQRDPHVISKYDDLRTASKIIFEFLQKIIFLPEKHCLIETSDPAGKKNYKLLELTGLMKEYEKASHIRELKCEAPGILALIQKQGKFVREVGFFLDHQKATVDSNRHLFDMIGSEVASRDYKNIDSRKDDLDSYWDIIGSRLDKGAARDSLMVSTQLGYFTLQKGLKFSMLDEPDFRDQFVDRLSERIFYGIASEDIYPEWGKLTLTTQKSYYPKWLSERDDLISLWTYMTSSVKKVGKAVLNAERSKRWDSAKVAAASALEYPEDQKMALKDGSFLVAPDKSSTITLQAMNKLKHLIYLRAQKDPKFMKDSMEYEAQMAILSKMLDTEIGDIKGSGVQAAPPGVRIPDPNFFGD